jgi:hypothetical protein
MSVGFQLICDVSSIILRTSLASKLHLWRKYVPFVNDVGPRGPCSDTVQLMQQEHFQVVPPQTFA